jgi:hypothetical protein
MKNGRHKPAKNCKVKKVGQASTLLKKVRGVKIESGHLLEWRHGKHAKAKT